MNYIKICPNCNRNNPESARVCENGDCRRFLGQVKPVPDLLTQQESVQPQSQASDTPTEACGPDSSPRRQARAAGAYAAEGVRTQRSSEPLIYLECRTTTKTYEVRSGQVVGRKDPTSTAHVQLEGIPDINFVSRNHCRFDHQNSAWFITVLPNATNLTQLNDTVIVNGDRALVRNGDILKLDVVPFQVRIII